MFVSFSFRLAAIATRLESQVKLAAGGRYRNQDAKKLYSTLPPDNASEDGWLLVDCQVN
jgi:hypothetical protein